MMPILSLQQKSRELGRIRIGAQVASGRGKRPTKLESFRFTTESRNIAERVAEMFGGQVQEWAGGTQAWEVFTTTTEFDVMVPPGDAALSQWMELWSGGGCQRRCDGFTEQLSGKACLCPADAEERIALAQGGEACKPTTRVNVILPDLPDVGVWRYESHGYYAAVELGGTAELLAKAREAGVIVPARLRLEQRSVKRAGQTRNFPVVVLEIGATLRELATGNGPQTFVDALPPAPSGALAIEAPKAPESVAVVAEPEFGMPDTANDLGRAVRECTDLSKLTDLARHARRQGWEQEVVEDDDGVLESLWDLLTTRRDQLSKGGN